MTESNIYSHLSNEIDIIWLYDPKDFEYVRQAFRTGWDEPPTQADFELDGEILVGYAIISENQSATLRWENHRVFFLKSYDRYYQPQGVYKIGCPLEAVDPLTIKPGFPGIKNDRAWGGKKPEAPQIARI